MFPFLTLAFLLGLKHSFDADHLVAVSNFLSRASSIKKSVKLSLYWAAGHMLTAIFITFLLFTFKDIFLSAFLEKMEMLVGVMLIVLGAWSLTLLRGWNVHGHAHTHGGTLHTHAHLHAESHEKDHAHVHLFGIGIVHGLASNDELLILLTATLGVSSLMEMVSGVAIFSFGVVVGMIAFGTLFTFSVIKIHRENVLRLIQGAVGVISIGYGAQLLLQLSGVFGA